MHTNHVPQRDPYDSLDRILRSELRWEAPPELTKQLLHLVKSQGPIQESVSSMHVMPSIRLQPSKYYSLLVLVLTCAVVWLSCSFAWQFYALLGTEFGVRSFWFQIQSMLNSQLQYMYQRVPLIHAVVETINTCYQYVYWLFNWLFVAIILWLALDGFPPRSSIQQGLS